MTQAPAIYDRYITDFDSRREERAREPQWMRDLRREAFDNFQKMGWPIDEKRNEAWKYTDAKPIARTEFRYPLAPGPTDVDIASLLPFDEGVSRLVFVDGHFAPALSSVVDEDRGSVTRLAEAVETDEALVHG